MPALAIIHLVVLHAFKVVLHDLLALAFDDVCQLRLVIFLFCIVIKQKAFSKLTVMIQWKRSSVWGRSCKCTKTRWPTKGHIATMTKK